MLVTFPPRKLLFVYKTELEFVCVNSLFFRDKIPRAGLPALPKRGMKVFRVPKVKVVTRRLPDLLAEYQVPLEFGLCSVDAEGFTTEAVAQLGSGGRAALQRGLCWATTPNPAFRLRGPPIAKVACEKSDSARVQAAGGHPAGGGRRRAAADVGGRRRAAAGRESCSHPRAEAQRRRAVLKKNKLLSAC